MGTPSGYLHVPKKSRCEESLGVLKIMPDILSIGRPLVALAREDSCHELVTRALSLSHCVNDS